MAWYSGITSAAKKVKEKVGETYKKADVAVGGYLPGGTTPSEVKTSKTTEPTKTTKTAEPTKPVETAEPTKPAKANAVFMSKRDIIKIVSYKEFS